MAWMDEHQASAVEFFVCLFGFNGISTFVGYLMPNPFLYN